MAFQMLWKWHVTSDLTNIWKPSFILSVCMTSHPCFLSPQINLYRSPANGAKGQFLRPPNIKGAPKARKILKNILYCLTVMIPAKNWKEAKEFFLSGVPVFSTCSFTMTSSMLHYF